MGYGLACPEAGYRAVWSHAPSAYRVWLLRLAGFLFFSLITGPGSREQAAGAVLPDEITHPPNADAIVLQAKAVERRGWARGGG